MRRITRLCFRFPLDYGLVILDIALNECLQQLYKTWEPREDKDKQIKEDPNFPFNAFLAMLIALMAVSTVLLVPFIALWQLHVEANQSDYYFRDADTSDRPNGNVGLTGSSLMSFYESNLIHFLRTPPAKAPRISQIYDAFVDYLGLEPYAGNDPDSCHPETSVVSKLTKDVNVLEHIHSHNDYWRRMPLFEALCYGVASVEADVWLTKNNSDLAVGHNKAYLDPSTRNLESLYTGPLMSMLEEVNCGNTDADDKYGVFYNSPETTLYLYVDFKSPDAVMTYNLLMNKYLKPLIDGGYVSYLDLETKEIVTRPLTVTLTGDYPTNTSDLDGNNDDGYFHNNKRFAFQDALLHDLPDDVHNASVVASSSLGQLLRTCSPPSSVNRFKSGLSDKEIDCVKRKVDRAAKMQLKTRIWGIPNWPVYSRNALWKQQLEDLHVDFLNVDDLAAASIL
ncbi:LAMI_0F14708g1_1 [Lachancea mirantina]|uniref:Altered inheritance of mitochondria protein 6 n=1 Tax=Lachancea mirantina TaxID=1230905 RepID=A0A1G4K491_9SACH|nr:LAMI_0F14708g1_1 [Lachancea mirantina]